MVIGFTTDTNLLKKMKDDLFNNTKTFDTMNIFIEYVDDLNNHTRSGKKLKYFLPDMVLDELASQKIIAFNTRYDDFKEKYEALNYALSGKLPSNNIESLVLKERQYMTKRINVLKLNYSSSLFRKIVNDAVKKRAPFDKSLYGEKTDSGFKDTLIWKTILMAKEIDECDKFYFCSSDKVFIDNEKELKNQFASAHPKTGLKIIYFPCDGSQRQNCLQAIISDNNLYKSEVIKLYDENLILNSIKNLSYFCDDDVYYYSNEIKYHPKEILFRKFTKDDFFIKNVSVNNDEYYVTVKFDTLKYVFDDNSYSPPKNISGDIKLTYKKENQQFKLIDSSIKNVGFGELTQYLSGISNIIKNFYDKSYKPLLDAVISGLLFNEKQNDVYNIISDKNSKFLNDYINLNDFDSKKQK